MEPTTTTAAAPAAPTTPGATVTPTNGGAPYTIPAGGVNVGTQNSPVIVTGDAAASTHAQNSADLDKILTTINTGAAPVVGQDQSAAIAGAQSDLNAANDPNYSDPYTKTLDQMTATSNASTANVIAGIKTSLSTQQNQTNDAYDRYSRGLSLLGIENNSSQATPDLFLGQQYQAQQDHLQKLQDLTTAENSAVMDAENARANNNLSLMTQKMNYVKDLQGQKAQTLKDLQATQQQTLQNYASVATEVAPAVYDALNTPGLTDDQKQQILQAVSQKYGGIPLDMLTSEVAKVKSASDQAAYGQQQDAIKDQQAQEQIDISKQNADTSASKASSGGASATAQKNTAVANITAHLNDTTKDKSGYSVKGPEGYVDPYEYVSMLQQWEKAGYTDKEFLAKFPVAQYVTKESYGVLPANIRPAASSGKKS